jgi:predicted nucleic acid-binding protein
VTFLPVYLDTSALVKLVVQEPESDALLAALDAWPDRVSSTLASVELHRALARAAVAPAVRRRAEHVLSGIVLLRLDDAIVGKAAELKDRQLRALDALHLASALSLGDYPDAFITYDERLARAASSAGLTVAHPGAPRLS